MQNGSAGAGWVLMVILLIPTGIIIYKANLMERIRRGLQGSPEWLITLLQRLAILGILFILGLIIVGIATLIEESAK